MRILILHNRYRQAGGEDAVVEAERALLERHGHVVSLVEADNAEIGEGAVARVAAGLSAIYSPAARRRVARAIADQQPEVVHVHNFFPLLSPSVFDACRDAQVPVVQTLHNYRLTCPNALLFRDGRPCEDCVGRPVAWPGVLHACYRGSRAESALVASMISLHRLRGTWTHRVDAYIALTEFQKSVLVRGGVPADRIHVKPNCVPGPEAPAEGPGEHVLYAGRLAPEKGVDTLIAAVEQGLDVPLVVAGEGPLRAELEARVAAAGAAARVTFVGWQDKPSLARLIARARVVVVPSRAYEAFPLAVLEAFAAGRPVVASAHGSLAEVVDAGETGWLATPGDPLAWRDAVRVAWSDAAEAMRLGARARLTWKRAYSDDAGYRLLMDVYEAAAA